VAVNLVGAFGRCGAAQVVAPHVQLKSPSFPLVSLQLALPIVQRLLDGWLVVVTPLAVPQPGAAARVAVHCALSAPPFSPKQIQLAELPWPGMLGEADGLPAVQKADPPGYEVWLKA